VEYAVALDYVFPGAQDKGCGEMVARLGSWPAVSWVGTDQGWLTLSLGTYAARPGKAAEAEGFYQASIDIFSQQAE
jgi:hypothetical protein